jgi:hypothetical protein
LKIDPGYKNLDHYTNRYLQKAASKKDQIKDLQKAASKKDQIKGKRGMLCR